MAWVSGPPPFWIDAAEVTNGQYAEWLWELPPEERRRRLPATGFAEDPASPGRFAVTPGLEARPVVGVRPIDALEYAAWRSEVEEATLRLPTEAEWRRAAGPGIDAGSRDVAPVAERRRRWSRTERGWSDRAPCGAWGLLAIPAELVTSGEGFAVKGRGDGLGIPPLRPALDRSDRADPDGMLPGVGFRLVKERR
jgi:formylglycine-generating enzyme required for sulfatase activity